MNDCRNCRFNTYIGLPDKDWVSCCHPVTIAKEPRWQKGDPKMVDYRTGDVPVSQIHNLQECPAWEKVPKFASVFCSSCGDEFGPSDAGFSHCADHAGLKATP